MHLSHVRLLSQRWMITIIIQSGRRSTFFVLYVTNIHDVHIVLDKQRLFIYSWIKMQNVAPTLSVTKLTLVNFLPTPNFIIFNHDIIYIVTNENTPRLIKSTTLELKISYTNNNQNSDWKCIITTSRRPKYKKLYNSHTYNFLTFGKHNKAQIRKK